MSNRIEAIGRVSYNASRIQPVRRYTEDEAKTLKETIEKQSEERQELNNYLKKYSNPEHYSFAELLEQAKNEK